MYVMCVQHARMCDCMRLPNQSYAISCYQCLPLCQLTLAACHICHNNNNNNNNDLKRQLTVVHPMFRCHSHVNAAVSQGELRKQQQQPQQQRKVSI